MSTPRPTPETDDKFTELFGCEFDDYTPNQKAAKLFTSNLERERDEARDRLRLLDWTPITEHLPTIEDANEHEDVEWSDGKDIWQNSFYLRNSNQHKATHWRRITLP